MWTCYLRSNFRLWWNEAQMQVSSLLGLLYKCKVWGEEMLNLIFAGFSVSWTADWQTCPGPGFINKDLIQLWYGLEIPFIFIFSLPWAIFSSWKPVFYVDIVQEKWHSGLVLSPVRLLFNLTSIHPSKGVSETGCLPAWVFCFMKMQYVFSNAISFCLI